MRAKLAAQWEADTRTKVLQSIVQARALSSQVGIKWKDATIEGLNGFSNIDVVWRARSGGTEMTILMAVDNRAGGARLAYPLMPSLMNAEEAKKWLADDDLLHRDNLQLARFLVNKRLPLTLLEWNISSFGVHAGGAPSIVVRLPASFDPSHPENIELLLGDSTVLTESGPASLVFVGRLLMPWGVSIPVTLKLDPVDAPFVNRASWHATLGTQSVIFTQVKGGRCTFRCPEMEVRVVDPQDPPDRQLVVTFADGIAVEARIGKISIRPK